MALKEKYVYTFSDNAYKIQTPCRILITGQTMDGKTQLITKLLKNQI